MTFMFVKVIVHPTDGYVRSFVLVADRLARIYSFLRRESSLRQVHLLLPLVAEREPPGLEHDTQPPVGEHLMSRDVSAFMFLCGLK